MGIEAGNGLVLENQLPDRLGRKAVMSILGAVNHGAPKWGHEFEALTFTQQITTAFSFATAISPPTSTASTSLAALANSFASCVLRTALAWNVSVM